MARLAFVFVFVGACGSRTPLLVGDNIEVDSGIRPGADAAINDASTADARPNAPHDASKRCTGRLQGWAETDVMLGGDFAGLVAASPETSGVWLAGGGRADVEGATRVLRVEVRHAQPRLAENVVLAGTEGWQPLALAVSPAGFALVARGARGEAWVALFARDGAITARTTIDELELSLGNNMEGDIAWSGTDVIVAALRFSHPDRFAVQRRDATLAVRWTESPIAPLSFRLRPDGSALRTRAALYAVTSTGLRVDPKPVSALSPIGAARAAWTGIDSVGFVLERDGAVAVHGAWPGGSFSSNGWIPVYESSAGIFITGNVDLAPFIGWFSATALEWIAIPRLGGGGIAYADDDSVGAFFAGIEIPRSEQPLRYWGCTR